jgi:hypothetical protein
MMRELFFLCGFLAIVIGLLVLCDVIPADIRDIEYLVLLVVGILLFKWAKEAK